MVHYKQERFKHQTLGDTKNGFDGMGPGGKYWDGLKTMFEVADHPIQFYAIKVKPLFQSVQ